MDDTNYVLCDRPEESCWHLFFDYPYVVCCWQLVVLWGLVDSVVYDVDLVEDLVLRLLGELKAGMFRW